jgi:hypothetical protein
MYIDPRDCGKIRLEVRDWKNGGNKVVFLRCQKPQECLTCARDSAAPYVKPIVEAGSVFSYKISDENWNATRQHLHREKISSYGKYPVDENNFILVLLEQINKEFAQPVMIDDWYSVVLKTHSLIGKRRSARGVFAKLKEESIGSGLIVTWPEPIFKDKLGNDVPVTALPDIIRTLLQYFSPLDKLEPENIDSYLDERARLKAALVLLYYNDYVLVGFNVVTKEISENALSNWNFVPMYHPQDAVLDDPIGAMALKMIYGRDIPSYSELPRTLHSWTDYKSEDERVFDELLAGTEWVGE